MCWFYVKNCIFVHMIDKIVLPRVEMLEPPLYVWLSTHGGIAMCYILPVLWMTFCLPLMT